MARGPARHSGQHVDRGCPDGRRGGERLFPRLLAVAETAWSAPEKRDFADFRRRLPLHLRQLERAGWNYRLDDVEGVCDDNVFIGAATVRLLPPESAELYYTLDGTVPDTESQRYTAPFSITDSCTLTLRCYNRRGVAAEIRRASFRPMRYAEPSADAGNLQNGLLVRWYDYDGDNCADIDEAPLQANFITDSVVIPDGVTGNIGLICDGYIDIPADGIYSFYTYSDDGSTLAIDGDGRSTTTACTPAPNAADRPPCGAACTPSRCATSTPTAAYWRPESSTPKAGASRFRAGC